MSTREFIRQLRRYARQHDMLIAVKRYESKGSHRRVYLGARNTTVPWTRDMTTGTVRAILKQLGVDASALR